MKNLCKEYIYNLVLQIWQEQKILDEWKQALIVAILKRSTERNVETVDR